MTNTYKCFYKGKSIDIQAETSWAAQKEAAKELKAKKDYQVTAVLMAKVGKQVVIDPSIL